MIRAKVWFKCAAMHDPVSPIIVKPCIIGWDAKRRKIDLVIERSFKGEELALRMKGWITIDPAKFVEVVKRHGRLAILDDRDLVVETETMEDYGRLLQELKSVFGDEVELELIKRK
ncbi:MAG: hypothetical protein RMJ15_09735 [Nitrososphaerota archaeon]|nr:hypothetical protein [Candidatus Bathyarchaeota archaeon]MDW8023995.1 hypothetical protein [Nitrososphaerota archaeon]